MRSIHTIRSTHRNISLRRAKVGAFRELGEGAWNLSDPTLARRERWLTPIGSYGERHPVLRSRILGGRPSVATAVQRRMKAKNFVALDFETTGLSHRRGDRVIEVAAIRCSGSRIVDRYVTFVDPGVSVPGMVTALTGITNSMLRGAPSPCEVVPKLAQFVGDDILVAHNASFDHGFLLAECSIQKLRWQPYGVACTMKLARRLLGGLDSYRLQSVADHLGVRFDSRAHRAEADALVVAKIVPKLQKVLEEDYGYEQFEPQALVEIGSWSIDSVRRKLQARQGRR